MTDATVLSAIWQIFFAVLVGAVLVGIGFPIVARLDRGRVLHVAEQAGIGFLIGAFVLYCGVFLIGTWWLNVYGMSALLAALMLAAIPGWRSLPWQALRDFIRTEVRQAPERPMTGILWLVLIGVAVTQVLQGLAPANDYDSLMYHLSRPQLDVEAGHRLHAWALGAGTRTTLFPEMMGHMSRLSLILADAGAAQMIHGLFSIAAAAAAAALAWRAAATRAIAVLAALLFLSCRAVVWQMGSVEVDAPLAAFSGFALVAYLAWRKQSEMGLMVLFGLAIGGGSLVKYHGFAVALAFAPLMIGDIVCAARSNLWRTTGHLMLGSMTALVVTLPHLIRNTLQSGSPLFPLFHNVFNPGAPDLFSDTAAIYGTGRTLLDLIQSPWTLSVMPMHYYDGMVLGAPYLLAFAPLVLLRADRGRTFLPMILVAGIYFVEWFYLLSQQVRFLLPIVPILSAMAAVGAAALWEANVQNVVLRRLAGAIFAAFIAVQAMFVGIYVMLRLPPALGLVSFADYHTKTPTLTGASYATCMYIRERLKPNERYYSEIQPHPFYCPQAQVIWRYFDDEAKWWLKSKTPPQMSFDEFLERADKMAFRFLIMPSAFENRRNDTGKSVRVETDLDSETRFGRYLGPAMAELTPLISGPFSSVYDGPAVIAWLKAHRDTRPASEQ